MGKTNTEEIFDERFQVVEEAICDAFLLLMKEKEFDKITVADVVKKAGIVRSTFYNHYENVPSLVNGIEDRSLKELLTLMENFDPRNNREICKAYFATLCNYVLENPLIAELLRSPRAGQFLEKTVLMFHEYVHSVAEKNKAVLEQNTGEDYSYMIASIIGGTIGIFHKWSHDNFVTSADKIADILTRMFLSAVMPFFSRVKEK